MTMKYIGAGLLQFILAYLFGFIGPYALAIGNGWENLAIPVGMTIGIFAGGAALWPHKRHLASLVAALVGSGVGMAVANIPMGLGFGVLLIPFILGMAAYYGYRGKQAVAA